VGNYPFYPVAGDLTLPVPVADGGTGQVTAAAAFTALAVGTALVAPSGDESGATDTASIQGLLNLASPGAIVQLADGTFYTDAPLTIPPQVTLRGTHSSHIDATPTCIQPVAGFSGASVLLMVDQATGGYPIPSTQQGIFFLTLEGINLTGSAIDGIQAQGYVHGVILQDIQIRDMPNHALNTISNSSGTAYSWRGTRLAATDCAGYGFSLGMTDCTWIDLESIAAGKSGFYFPAAPSNSHLIGCRSEYSGYNGFDFEGAWGTGGGSGGCMLTSCSTDGSVLNGVYLSATGTTPVIFEGLMLRRDGANGISGGGGYAGFSVSGATVPVLVNGITVFPGIAQAGGANSPEYGISITSAPAYVDVSAAFLHAATAGLNWDGTGGVMISGAATRTGSTSSPGAISFVPGLALQAGTPLAGFALADSTGTIISWTVPNDGQLHRVLFNLSLHVTSADTGGAIQITTVAPDGTSQTNTAFATSLGTGLQKPANIANGFFPVEPGSAVTVTQSGALTVGAAILWAEIWGS
jgi:hypothetical protein